MALKRRKIKNNFDGKKVGVEKGTTTALALTKLFMETGMKVEIVYLNSKKEELSALKKGEIDILSVDQVVLIGLILEGDNLNDFTILPDMFSFEPVALAVRKKDADFRLIADRTLVKLYRTRQIDSINDEWFSRFSPEMPSGLQASIELNSIPEE